MLSPAIQLSNEDGSELPVIGIDKVIGTPNSKNFFESALHNPSFANEETEPQNCMACLTQMSVAEAGLTVSTGVSIQKPSLYSQVTAGQCWMPLRSISQKRLNC